MRFHLQILILLVSGMFLNSAVAGGMALKDRDCAEILKRWAADPNSVPQSLVDTCQEKLAAALPDMNPAAGSAVDPCAGPNSANLINCWGPWAALAPAAGDAVAPIVLAKGDPNLRPDEFTRDPAGDGGVTPALGSCTPGASCGFATLVPGTATNVPSEQRTLTRFEMDPDGTGFVVDPGGPNELNSNPDMVPSFFTNLLGQEIMRSEVTDGDIESKMIARVYRDNNGNIVQAADIWKHGSIVNTGPGNANAGMFAWGIASTQATLDTLNAGQVSASFAGNMSTDPGTLVNMTVNFGSQTNWSGNWTNPAYAFSAGGAVTGVDLISNPAQFSNNVQTGSYVQGVLLGEQGNQAVANAIDVNLQNIGNVKDVGLLRQQ